MAALLAGFFVSSSPRFAADAGKQAPTSSTVLAPETVEASKPSTLPSPSVAPEPTTLPATSQDHPVQTVVVPSSPPAPSHAPAPTPAPVTDTPPAVVLTVSPQSGLAPLTVTADASRSTDTDATGIASYEFNFGDGVVVRSMRGAASATHTYCPPGPDKVTYRVTVTVTDTAGQRSSAFVNVIVTPSVTPTSTC